MNELGMGIGADMVPLIDLVLLALDRAAVELVFHKGIVGPKGPISSVELEAGSEISRTVSRELVLLADRDSQVSVRLGVVEEVQNLIKGTGKCRVANV